MLQIRKGVECFTIAQVDSPERTLRVPISSSGLQKFILTDQDGLILSERSVFVEDGTMTAAIDVACPSPDYVPKQKWGLSLQLPDGSDIDSAVVSVSVVRSAFRNYQQEGNISSYMLLSSEINGFIENPDYYFDPDIPASLRMNHLDLLLLIQGWTYYDDEKIVSTVEYPKEQVQALMGEVKSVFKTRPKNFMLTWMAPELGFSQVTAVERGSRFVVDSLDFPDSTLFIVVIDKVKGTRSYYPVIEEDFAPKPNGLYMARGAGRGKSVPSATPRSVVATDDNEPVFLPGDVEVDTIRTAVISAIAPRIRSPFGSSELSNIKEQKDFVAYGNYNLLSYILMTNVNLQRSGNDVINLKTGYLSELNPSKEGTEEEDAKYNKVSLFVNGVVTPWDMAESIMMGNVQKLSVTTTMNSDAFLARSFGGIVLVELLEGGMGVPQSLNKQVNAVVVRPLGWQRPKAFYNPVYDRRRTLSLPDRRNTVYWNPSVRIGATSPKEITVMTEDRADGPYFLRIEGRTSDGRWISTTKVLDAIF